VPAEADGGSLVLAGTVSSVLVDLQQAEDSPHVSGHRGIMFLGVRRDSLAALTDASGDYIPQAMDSFGRAMVTGAVSGTIGHGSTATSAAPILEGIEGRSSDQAPVASGQVTRAVGSLLGKQATLPYALPSQSLDGAAALTDTSDQTLAPAAGPGVRTYLTTLVVASDATVPVILALKEGSTVRMRIPAPAKGGAVIPLPVPLRGSANTAWTVACLSAPGASIFVSAAGFTAAE
jgi:hypothetical protein